MANTSPAAQRPSTRLAFAGGVLGFALGGFFDGILLHQVLQWHHLFSLVPGEAWRDIKNQILMDGWFHVLHYAIAIVGLWLLWRARADISGSGSDLHLLGAVLLGFGVWQFVDIVLFHWVLVIHRIRVGVPSPLAYDLGWLAAFGVTSLLAGLWLRRRGGAAGGDGGGPGHPAVATALALVATVGGSVAALPPPGVTTTLALFRPGIGAADAFAAVAAVGGRVVWADPSGELLAFEGGSPSGAWRLYGHGALLVAGGGAGPLAGSCLAWSRRS
jgi:uncharacterized membrane protein